MTSHVAKRAAGRGARGERRPRTVSARRVPRSASRREQILAAALDVFLAKGVARASIDDIRRRSGASIGSIYHHFDGKRGIAAALFVDALRGYQDDVLAVLDAHADTRAGIEAVVDHHLAWVAGN